MFRTQVGFPQLWQFPSPRPWERPWSGEAACSAYSSSKRQKHHEWKRDTSNGVFSVEVKALSFTVWIQFDGNKILTEWTKAFRRYLQRRDKAMGLEKSFTSGVPYTWKSRKVLSWAGYTVKKQPHTHLQVTQTLVPPWGSSRGRVPGTGWGWYRCSWLQSAGWLSASSWPSQCLNVDGRCCSYTETHKCFCNLIIDILQL